MRSFGLSVASKLIEKSSARLLRASADAVFGPSSSGAIGGNNNDNNKYDNRMGNLILT